MIIRLLIAMILVWTGIAQAGDDEPRDSTIKASSAIVYDLDNDVILFEQNADQRIPPASLTKVMSMFLAMDYLKDGHTLPDAPVPVSKAAAAAGGSSMGLKAGEMVPFERLLMGMAISSGNDASHAIAEHVGGSVPAFVKMMNARALALGMEDSNFQNPHGLPAENQYTTARDMLSLARAYLRAHPDALKYHNQQTLRHGGYTSWNKNPLLGQYPGADGLKSGWIRASGYNLIFTAAKGSKRLLAVILGSPDPFSRGGEACRLLDAGFLVCDNDAVSVAAALEDIPFDANRIDPLKVGRENGLLKKRVANKRLLALKNQPGSKNLAASKNGKNRMRRPALADVKNRAKQQASLKKTVKGKKQAEARGNGKNRRKEHASGPAGRARRS